MLIKSIAPWFGAKRILAPRIVEELGDHRCYWEPFCGSMAVLMAKPPVAMETVNDLHEDLVNLARIIRDSKLGSKLYRRLNRTLMSENLYRQAVEDMRDYMPGDDLVERAYNFFIAAWLGRNGNAGTKKYNYQYCKRYSANGGHAAKRWRSVIKSIPAWRRRMGTVTILNTDAFDLLQEIRDEAGTAIYVDPPYLVKSDKYIHDFRAGDHERLAKLLRRFKLARVVVSYYAHPLIADLYPAKKWTRVDCPVTKSLVNAGKQDPSAPAKIAPEVLLINGPSYTQKKTLFDQGGV